MSISTHVLDQTLGRPAAGITVTLRLRHGDHWHDVATAVTDDDGRVRSLLPDGRSMGAGEYQLAFATGEYFSRAGKPAFYPQVTIDFIVDDPRQRYHVPLLLGPWGYTTYRGS